MPQPLSVVFAASDCANAADSWRIDRISPVIGGTLAPAPFLTVHENCTAPAASIWSLRGTTSNTRYTTRAETDALIARQEGLGRPAATRAALIPIRKTDAWWALAQDERRRIFEESSRHIAIGLEYLPGIARRLHHCRELGEQFDFLTWFEYGPQDAGAFEDLVGRFRATEEWQYVDREIDIRLSQRA